MAAPRRVAGPDAKNRGILVDAAEQLMLEQGYSAVTARRVAERAGLKFQLVHYYFRSMDDLFLAILERRVESAVDLQADLLRTDRPLHALWRFGTDPADVRITLEFVGLSVHRPVIRAALAEAAERFRAIQTETLSGIIAAAGVDAERFPPGALAVMLTGAARTLVLEQAIGMDGGHAEAFALIERELALLEPDPAETAEARGSTE
jgi:AcrR family transcriptional regulator